MNISKRLVVLGLGGLILGVSGGGVLAQGQVHEARGTVIAVTDTSLTMKAGAQQLTVYVDSETHLEVRAAARDIQQAQAGRPSPRVNDFFEAGQAVLVRYREEDGRNHALDISRVGSAGAGGGSISEAERLSDGKVTLVTASQLTIDDSGREITFAITRDTSVLAKGASKATKTAGGSTPITTFVRPGDTVSVSYRATGEKMTASEVRVRIASR